MVHALELRKRARARAHTTTPLRNFIQVVTAHSFDISLVRFYVSALENLDVLLSLL